MVVLRINILKMWFFTYFSVTYFTTSYLSFVYDAVIGGFKHHDRTRQEVVQCAKDMTPTVLFNVFAVTLPYSLFLESYIKDKERNDYGFLVNFILSYISADFLSYWAHRLFHHPALYFIHKVHHEYMHPLAMGALYAHPIDFFVINLFPFTFSIFFLYPPDWVIKAIIVIAILVSTLQSHGGYTVFDDAHLKHHKFYKVNYGLGIFDRMFGTYA